MSRLSLNGTSAESSLLAADGTKEKVGILGRVSRSGKKLLSFFRNRPATRSAGSLPADTEWYQGRFQIKGKKFTFEPQTLTTRSVTRDRVSMSEHNLHIGSYPPGKTMYHSSQFDTAVTQEGDNENGSSSNPDSAEPALAEDARTHFGDEELHVPHGRESKDGYDGENDIDQGPPSFVNSEDNYDYESRMQSIFTWRKAAARRHAKLELADSRDFDPIESGVWQQSVYLGHSDRRRRLVIISRWLLTSLIAIVTAFIAMIVIYGADYLTFFKFFFTGYALYGCAEPPCGTRHHNDTNASMLYMTSSNNTLPEEYTNKLAAFGVYFLICVSFTFVASLFVGVLEPVALGSGIPEILMILNGIKVPKGLRFKTLVAKVGGIIFTVAGGMPVGREGPMIHAAAILGAGVSQGMSTTIPCLLCRDLRFFFPFRNDIEKRDFITCGIAAGVAAAFGAPIGGVLFALEEGASFWFRQLTWRALLCSFLAICVLSVLNSIVDAIKEHGSGTIVFGELSTPGMFNFGSFSLYNTGPNDRLASYNVWELPIFLVMGLFGGAQGALFCFLNEKISKLRKKYVKTIPRRLIEVAGISGLMAIMSFSFPNLPDRCVKYHEKYISPDEFKMETELVRFGCPRGYFNDLASLFLNPPETVIKLLFHYPAGFSWQACLIFFFPYFIFTCVTNGLHIPGSVFIPSLLFGSAFGRAVGALVHFLAGSAPHADPGTYSLVGAAACLGGISRITISLAVIMMETTGNLQYGLPLVVTLIAAQWFGNLLGEGLYDIKIHLTKTAFMHEDIPLLANQLRACDVMAPRVKIFPPIARVRDIVHLLTSTRHNGFPVIEILERKGKANKRKLLGLVLRKHISVAFVSTKPSQLVPVNERVWVPKVLWHHLECMYPSYPDIGDIELTEDDMEKWVDLTPYMNPAPYVVQEHATLRRAFQTFRTMGIRHLVVIDSSYCLRGLITRHNLTHHHIQHCLDELFSGLSDEHTDLSNPSDPKMLPAFVRSLDNIRR